MRLPIFILLFSLSCQVLIAQNTDTLNSEKVEAKSKFFEKLSFGVQSGMNYSHLNGELKSGKWETQSGPTAGVFIDYWLSRHFNIHTELFYQKLYYSHRSYQYVRPEYDPYSSIFPYSSIRDARNYSFYRIPLQIGFNTFSKPRFNLSAGVSFSFLDEYSDNRAYYRGPVWHESMLSQEQNHSAKEDLPQHDFGFLFSAGFSYPVSDDFEIGLDGRYYTGHREFMESYKSKLEALELMMKIGYTGFMNKQTHSKKLKESGSDNKVFMTYKSGLLMSRHRGNPYQEHYSPGFAFSPSISFEFLLSQTASFQTELLFDRKGYKIEAPSQNVFRMVPSENDNREYQTDTHIKLDYFVLPFYMTLRFGEPVTLYLNGGFYYGYNMNAHTTGEQVEVDRGSQNYLERDMEVYDYMEGFIKNNDWGWLTGAGLRLPVYNQYRLDIELRYDQSFINSFDLPERYESPDEDRSLFNETFHLMVGLQIPVN
ncbi:MAG: PorT family protein [Bacteroidales bacterium]|nr:PorT family protein [Bacteroidales bacterium]MCF8339261.1 PorT family protein [Bacteroidales bacterium]